MVDQFTVFFLEGNKTQQYPLEVYPQWLRVEPGSEIQNFSIGVSIGNSVIMACYLLVDSVLRHNLWNLCPQEDAQQLAHITLKESSSHSICTSSPLLGGPPLLSSPLVLLSSPLLSSPFLSSPLLFSPLLSSPLHSSSLLSSPLLSSPLLGGRGVVAGCGERVAISRRPWCEVCDLHQGPCRVRRSASQGSAH